MKVGGESRPNYLRRRHLDRMLVDCGLGAAAARRRLRSLATRAPAAIEEARRDLAERFWDDEHLDKVVASSVKRAESLLGIVDAKR